MEHEILDSGFASLRAGDSARALETFRRCVQLDASPAALDGLGQALWWSRQVEAGISMRTRAYAGYRRSGDFAAATHIAVWIAREKLALHPDAALGEAWIDRAAVTAEQAPGSAAGWVSLARAQARRDPDEAIADLGDAVDTARRHADPDLEIMALAAQGVVLIGRGDPDLGIRKLGQAMAAATAGEYADRRTLAEAYCALIDAAELLGADDRLAPWSAELLRSDVDVGPLAGAGSAGPQALLSAFCSACCGGVFLVTRRLDEAEAALLAGLAELRETGLRSRCVHPAALLAELRLVQGRLDDAAELLWPIEDLPEAVRPLAQLELAQGSVGSAANRLRSALANGMVVASLPWLALLVDAEAARGDAVAAGEVAARIAAVADLTGSVRHQGEAALAAGKAVSLRSPRAAVAHFRRAALAFSQASMALPAARSRLLLARALAESDAGLAVTEARSARAAFDRLGATAEADAASAFLRQLGVRSSPGPRRAGRLSEREQEVLRLIAHGMSNPEIADRLFISPKTAGHHVSSILRKLDLRSRAEAAAYAAVHGTAVTTTGVGDTVGQ